MFILLTPLFYKQDSFPAMKCSPKICFHLGSPKSSQNERPSKQPTSEATNWTHASVLQGKVEELGQRALRKQPHSFSSACSWPHSEPGRALLLQHQEMKSFLTET